MYSETSQLNDTQVYPDVESESIDKTLSILVVTGIVTEWLAWVIVAHTTGVASADIFAEPRSKPFVYYILHAAGMFSVLGAGLLAFFRGYYQGLGTISRAAFWVLVCTSITWALVAYDLDDYISWQAMGSTGPFIWLTGVLVFAGMDRSIWKVLEPVIEIISYLTAALALFTIITTFGNLDERWFSAPVQYMVVLMWFGGWTFLTAGDSRGLRLFIRCVPFLVFVLTAIVTRTRSWFLMSILLLVVNLFFLKSEKSEDIDNRGRRLVSFIAVGTMVLIIGYFLKDTLFVAFDAFLERGLEDTRTEQYSEFFSQVSVSDLLLGRGPQGTWFWQGDDYQFFDNAYLWMAFIGGLPTLISYTILVIVPGLRAYFLGARGNDAAAAVLLILWGFACAGISTYISPSLSPYAYLIYLMAGRCLGFIAESNDA